MVCKSAALASLALAALLRGGAGMRNGGEGQQLGAPDLGQEPPLTGASFVELVEQGHLVADLAGGDFGRSIAAVESLLNSTGPRFTHLVAASAPVSTACSWWQNSGITDFYKSFAYLCGVAGEGQSALDAHIERVWALLQQAHRSLNHAGVAGGRTLKVFVAPEWTFRRYPVNGAGYVAPLTYNDVQHIVGSLVQRFATSGEDWSDWLVVPGSIFWGVPFVQTKTIGYHYGGRSVQQTKYMVFNTLPVFHAGKLAYHHNKFAQADNINKENEVWGYEVIQQFPHTAGCDEYGSSQDRICGTAKFLEWLGTQHPGRADFVEAVKIWGVKQPHAALIVNGLAVGMDICLDHRMTLGEGARASERLQKVGVRHFDLQFLVSSGMAFDIPEEDGALSLLLRDGGVGVSADGIGGPTDSSRLFVKKETGGEGMKWHGSHGAVSPVIKRIGNQYVQQLTKGSLEYDFEQRPASLQGSWASGCRGASAGICEMCQGRFTSRAVADLFNDFRYRGERKIFCDTQPGNWNLLKVWATPTPLKEPQATVVRQGWYKETAAGQPDPVMNVVAKR